MIYFFEVFLNETDAKSIEKGIRSHSIEKYYNLDILKSTVFVETEERLFWGLEKKTSLKLLRIRNVIEFFLPKLIIKFDKNDFSKYSIRLSLLSFFISILILVGFIRAIIDTVKNITNFDSILASLTLIITFYLLTKLEMRLVNKKINKAIQNSK